MYMLTPHKSEQQICSILHTHNIILLVPVDDIASLILVGGLLSAVDSLPAGAVELCTSLLLSTTTATDALYTRKTMTTKGVTAR